MSAGEDDEGMGVEVLAPIQWLTLGIDAVEPAAVLGVVEMPLQRTEQRCGPLRRARLLDTAAEQVQLASTGHCPVALGRQRVVLGIQGFVGQCHLGVPAWALPQRHDTFGNVLGEAGQFGQGGAGVGHECARHNRAVRHGSRSGVSGCLGRPGLPAKWPAPPADQPGLPSPCQCRAPTKMKRNCWVIFSCAVNACG